MVNIVPTVSISSSLIWRLKVVKCVKMDMILVQFPEFVYFQLEVDHYHHKILLQILIQPIKLQMVIFPTRIHQMKPLKEKLTLHKIQQMNLKTLLQAKMIILKTILTTQKLKIKHLKGKLVLQHRKLKILLL